jgi:hypothetical protein
MSKIEILTFTNAASEMSLRDVFDFAREANTPGAHVTFLKPEQLAGYDYLENGVVVIWTGPKHAQRSDIRDAFIAEWEGTLEE